MKKFALLGVCAALAMSAVSVAPAAYAAEGGDTPNAYTECGIGASLFPNNGGLAAVSNVIWDWGTTALSSALSSPSQCNGGKAKTAMLVGKTYAGLEADIATGEGKYLTAVADVMACSTSSRSAMYAEVRNNFAAEAAKPAFASKNTADKGEALYLIVEQAGVNAKCTAI